MDDTLTDEYAKGWLAMSEMIWSGSSWSGRERNVSFLNLGDGDFVDISSISGFDHIDDARALALTDWDLDGDLDVWLRNRTGPQLRFLENKLNEKNFLSIKLQGTKSNRDAVGARVTVRSGDKKLVQEVAAGSGYMAQSGKRLHFGLGDDPRIDAVEVRWPGGEIESISPPKANRHYSLLEGQGKVSEIGVERLEFAKPKPLEIREPSGKSAIVLREPVPLPDDVVDGGLSSRGGNTLIVFWANWCPNCVAELVELRDHNSELVADGLAVIPMSIDPPKDQKKAMRVAKRLKFPWGVQFTGDKRMELFMSLLTLSLDIHQAMTIPMSFLVDREGRIQVIYSGAAGVEQLRADVVAMENGTLSRSQEPGRWFETPKRGFRDVVTEMKNARHLDWARFYLKLDRASR
ncbi:MAG TPA: redoxin domain-containing protein [Planctomycetes bacterium]|nr:redoxin domain-containing protein [Planctomycetota bacterium]